MEAGIKIEKKSAHTNIASACVRAEAFFRDWFTLGFDFCYFNRLHASCRTVVFFRL